MSHDDTDPAGTDGHSTQIRISDTTKFPFNRYLEAFGLAVNFGTGNTSLSLVGRKPISQRISTSQHVNRDWGVFRNSTCNEHASSGAGGRKEVLDVDNAPESDTCPTAYDVVEWKSLFIPCAQSKSGTREFAF